MDLSQIESCISIAASANGIGNFGDSSAQRIEANRQLDSLRQAPERWEVGLKLFFGGTSETSRFFGLTLVRSSITPELSMEVKKTIREALMNWIHSAMRDTNGDVAFFGTGKACHVGKLPAYLLNNLVTVLTLCVKVEYPSSWPDAFDQLLQFGSTNFVGLDFSVRLLTDLDREVVTYEQGRSSEEIARSAAIKDAMRANGTTGDVVKLLCSSAVFLRSKVIEIAGEAQKVGRGDEFNGDTPIEDFSGATVSQVHLLARRCLRGLSTYITWVDINLVVQNAMNTIFQCLQDQVLCSAALACVYSLVKKGMDPVLKVRLLQSIDILGVLRLVPTNVGANRNSFSQTTMADDDGADYDGEENHVETLGSVVDMILLELCGCWAKYEEMLTNVKSGKGSGNAKGGKGGGEAQQQQQQPELNQEEREGLHGIASTCASMMSAVMPLVMQIFSHEDMVVSCTMLPSLSRLLQILKFQKQYAAQLAPTLSNPNLPWKEGTTPYFQVVNFLPTVLGTVYHQMQFRDDFQFDEEDDEDLAIIEMKQNVRKLFVNCCRIHPDQCLQLIQAVFQSLPQPLSSVPVGPIEAALQLAYAFSECGPGAAGYVNDGAFPALINALAGTDITSHPHPQVLLIFFDIAMRYTKLCLPSSIRSIVSGIVGSGGLHHHAAQVRTRAAYCFLRLTESMEARAHALLPYLGTIATIIVSKHDSGSWRADTAILADGAEIHLLEAVSMITRPRGMAALMPIDEGKPMSQQLSVTVELLSKSSSFGSDNSTGGGAVTGNGGVANGSNADDSVAAGGRLTDEQSQQMQLSHQEQHNSLRKFVSIISERMDQLLSVQQQQQQLGQQEEDVVNALAHKITCLAALAKSIGKAVSQERVMIMQPAAMYVVNLGARMAHFGAIRSKIVMFLHRMVASLGPDVIQLFGHSYEFLLRHGEGADTDQIVQVANQIMSEFGHKALPLVDQILGPTLRKFQFLIGGFELTQQENKWAAERSSSATLATLGLSPASSIDLAEAPHVDVERAALQKQYLEFLRQMCTHNCQETLMSADNRYLLEHVLRQLLKGLGGSGAGLILPLSPGSEESELKLEKLLTGPEAVYNSCATRGSDGGGGTVGGGTSDSGAGISGATPPRVSNSAGYALRRISLNVLVGLAKSWLTASMRSSGVPDKADDSTTRLSVEPSVVAGVAQAFRHYLLDHALPLALGGFTSGIVTLQSGHSGQGTENLSPQYTGRGPTEGAPGSPTAAAVGRNGESRGVAEWVRLELTDAQAMGVIGDVAALLFALAQVLGREEVATYLQQALPRLGWGAQSSQGAIQLVLEQGQPLVFRDGFKKLVRNYNS